MATEKVKNYTDAQEQLIRDMVRENGGKADKALAEKLAADERMNSTDGPRNARSIIAKITRMDDVTYVRQEPTTKDGKPVSKKQDIVKAIADLSGITASKLSGLDNAPKLALEVLRDAFAERKAA